MADKDKQPRIDWERANTHPRPLMGVPRQPNGRNAMDMLLSPVDGGRQDDPELTEELWYATSGVVGPGDSLDSNPDQEGPGTESAAKPKRAGG